MEKMRKKNKEEEREMGKKEMNEFVCLGVS